jgi:hypothetical protein
MRAEASGRLANQHSLADAPTTPIFRSTGEYFGFLQNGALFAADGTYLGWIDEGIVWHKDGTFCGQVVEQNYILKKPRRLEPLARIPRTPPVSAIPPMRIMSRPARMLDLGCHDALEQY